VTVMRDGGWTILSAVVCRTAIAAALALSGAVREIVACAAEGTTVSPVAAGLPIGPLAASGNGQTVYGVDESRRAVVAFDPRDPERRRDAIGPAGAGVPAPVVVGCLPGDLLAVVVRAGEEWSLRTYRVAPGRPADPAAPVQAVRIGRAAGMTPTAGVAVSQSRDWLAVAGLPEPLPPVVRAVFAGAGVRPLSADECPAVPAERRVVAVAVSPADELVLVDAPTQEVGPVAIAFHNAAGREILRLDTGLANVRGAAFGRGDGTLWLIVVAQGGAKPGLVRVDPAIARRADHQDPRDSEERPTR
jgi:hypothetical protein